MTGSPSCVRVLGCVVQVFVCNNRQGVTWDSRKTRCVCSCRCLQLVTALALSLRPLLTVNYIWCPEHGEGLCCAPYLVVRLHDLDAHAAQRALQAADRARDALQGGLRLAQAARLVEQRVMARRHLRPQPALENAHSFLREGAQQR